MNPYLAAVIGVAGLTGIALGVGPSVRARYRRWRDARRTR